jgi:hypothetical protein
MKEVLFKANGNRDLIVEVCKYLKEKFELKQTSDFLANDLDDGVHIWFKVSEVE